MAQTSSKKKKQSLSPTPQQIVQNFLKHFNPLTTINLILHESKCPPKLPGGHTILKHVNVTEAQLHDRITTQNITAAGRFTDLDTAHAAITEAIAVNFQQVLNWATSNKVGLSLFHELSYTIGVVIESSDLSKVQPSRRIIVSFLKDSSGTYSLENSIITSYPTLEIR